MPILRRPSVIQNCPGMYGGGGGGGATYTTWDSSFKHASMVLSNSDTTFTTGGSGYYAIRSVSSKTSGKWYVEATVGTLIYNPGDGIGICNSSMVNTQGGDYGGTATAGIYTSNGAFNIEGAGLIPLDADRDYVSTNVIGLRLDADSGIVGIRNVTTGGSWATANFSSMSSPLASPWYIAGYAVDSGAGFTMNFGASAFVGAVPGGFTAGWTA